MLLRVRCLRLGFSYARTRGRILACLAVFLLFLPFEVSASQTNLQRTPASLHYLAPKSAESSDPPGISDWNQFQGNASHTGDSAWTGPTKNTVVWSHNFGGSRDGIIESGHLLILAEPDSGGLYGLNEMNGQQVYSGFTVNNGPVATSYPASGGGLVYAETYWSGFFSGGDDLVADSASTGNNAWNIGSPGASAEGPYGWSFTTYYNGSVYYALDGVKTLYSYQASTDTQQWTAQLSNSTNTIPTIGNGMVLMGNSNNLLTAISALSGTTEWTYRAAGNVSDTPSYSNGMFFFGTAGGTVYSISDTGSTVWKASVGASVESTPAVANGIVYVGANNGMTYALNSATGATLWQFQTGGAVTSSPAISSNGIVYVGSTAGILYGLTATTGKTIWQDNLGAPVSGLLLDSGYLFAVASNGAVYALSTQVGVTLSYTVQGGGTGYSPPTLTFVLNGVQETIPLNATAFTYIIDIGSTWNVTTSLPGSTATQRWQTKQAASTTANSSQTTMLIYYHQYLVTASYSVSGGGTPGAPTFTSTAFGTPFSSQLTTQPVGIWIDAGAQYSISNSLPSSSSSERWISQGSSSGTVTAPLDSAIQYLHQYYVSLQASPPNGGKASPQSEWASAGATLAIGVSVSQGWAFENWRGSGSGSYTGSNANNTITIGSPIAETATFYPGLTIVAQSGGTVTYSYSGNSGSIAGGSTQTVYIPIGTNVVLTAMPSFFLYQFSGWTGAAVSNREQVNFRISLPASVESAFGLNYQNIELIVGVVAAIIVISVLMMMTRKRRKRRAEADTAKKIEELKQLLDAGLITQTEYEEKKRRATSS